VSDYVRGEDVLDIWFDSGASWAAVLEGTSAVLKFLQTDATAWLVNKLTVCICVHLIMINCGSGDCSKKYLRGSNDYYVIFHTDTKL